MNNQIYFFDTSFLVALMYVSDAHRDDAISYITTLDQDRVDYYINEHIFFELVTWMTYRQGPSSIDNIMNYLNGLGCEIVSSSLSDYTSFFIQLDEKISLQDASAIFDAVALGGELLTFDKQQKNIFDTF